MQEHHMKGTSIGVQRLETPDEGGNTWRILVVDGQVTPQGALVPGSGSGEQFWIYMDDAAAAIVRQALEGASGIAVPKAPKLVISRGKLN